jgi:carboxypeptidase T
MRVLMMVFASVLLLSGQVYADTTKYDSVKTFLKDLAAKYPKTVELFDLGESDANDVIKAVRIGHGPVKQLVVATHHGNEYGSTEVAKAFAQSLAADPLPDATVTVIPVLNISGYDNNDRREEARGTTWDPNRNYPGPCGTEGPFTLKSTSALAKYIDAEGIVTSATLHTFYPAVVYPWGISTQDVSTPYDNLFINLVKAATVESGYQIGNSTQVIYPADGCYEDYAFWKYGIWSILFELGNSHTPSNNDIQEMIKTNVPGMRRMLALAPKQRATDHEFKGKCDTSMRIFDRHDE